MKEGILIAADRNAEKLLPWWWGHYSRHNNRPVAIVDFGMSKKGQDWCSDRMEIIPFPQEPSFVRTQKDISLEQAKAWKKRYRGPLWTARQAWFKKPKACLLSPFELTLWIDLDCEVCGPLDALFAEWEQGIELKIVREDFRLSKQEMFNSGVLLYQKGSPFLQTWESLCKQQNGTMLGDQDVLTHMLLAGKIRFKELPPFYNWLMYGGFHPGIVIAHWAGAWGKEYIRKFGGLHSLMRQILI